LTPSAFDARFYFDKHQPRPWTYERIARAAFDYWDKYGEPPEDNLPLQGRDLEVVRRLVRTYTRLCRQRHWRGLVEWLVAHVETHNQNLEAQLAEARRRPQQDEHQRGKRRAQQDERRAKAMTMLREGKPRRQIMTETGYTAARLSQLAKEVREYS
jgi:hypothetical protein